jgi:predicted GIY-YIG superfamily endonuclease
MASVYILYSCQGDCFYTGATENLIKRFQWHLQKEFPSAFTSKFSDWEIFIEIPVRSISVVLLAGLHI